MKKHILFLTLFFLALTLNAQEKNISIGPKNFNNTIGVKISLEKKADITFKIFNTANEKIKQFKFKNTTSNFFKVDLTSLKNNTNYTIKVYIDNKLSHTKEIHKNPKH